MNKITFSDKVDTKVVSAPEINKVTASTLNEVKTIVNETVDQVEINNTAIGQTVNITGDQSISGIKTFNDDVIISKIIAGNSVSQITSDPVFLVTRIANGAESGHAFADNSHVDLSIDDAGYNPFDSKFKIIGVRDYDHFVSFQSIPTYESTGDAVNYYGYYNKLTINSGTITNNYGSFLGTPTGTNTAGLTNNYAYVSEQDSGYNGLGTINPSVFFEIDFNQATSLPATSGTAPSTGTISRHSNKSITSSILDMGMNGSNGFWFQSTDYTNLGSTYPLLFNPNGGYVVIGGTSASTTDALQVNGDVKASIFKGDWNGGNINGNTTLKNAFVLNFERTSYNTRQLGIDSEGFYIYDVTRGAYVMKTSESGEVTVADLSGTGNRVVVADSTGKLVEAAIGTGLSFDGTTLTSSGSGGTISGSGTSGKLTKWSGATSIGDSIMTESASAIDVAGTLQATGYKSSDGSAGISTTYTIKANDELVIKNGIITAINEF